MIRQQPTPVAAGQDDDAPADFDMAALIAEHLWARTDLGPAEGWPQNLKMAVDTVVDSPLAMVVLWGPSLIQIYNARYAQLLGNRHPEGLGQPVRDCWPAAWNLNASLHAAMRRGRSDPPPPGHQPPIAWASAWVMG